MKAYRSEAGEREVQQEQAEVSWSETVGEHEDQAAHNGDGQRVEVEPETVLQAIREHGVSVGIKYSEDVRRSDEQERDGVVVAERFRKAGEEVLETRAADDTVVLERDV